MNDGLQKLLGFSSQRHSISTEIRAGLTTFFAMMYILPSTTIMFSVLLPKGYPLHSLYTATALTAVIGSLLMAFVARRPFGVAPGMSFNLFVVQTMCLALGYSWQFTLTAVLIEGLLYVALCLSNLRQIVFDIVPASLKYSIGAGVGLIVAMQSFKHSGLLVEGSVFSHLDTLTQPTALLFILGLVFTAFFSVLKIPGALLISMVLTALVGIPFGVTHIPSKFFSMPESPMPLFCQFSFADILSPDLWVCVIALLFFDVFHTLGTATGIMANAGMIRGNGRMPFQQRIMLSDAMSTVVGACLGCSTATVFSESSSGVAEGGRTGVTALVTAFAFVFSLFLTPFILSIPQAAVLPLVVISGFYMFSAVRHIDFRNPVEAMPAFCTIMLMGLTNNVVDGIISGIFAYGALSMLESAWRHRNENREYKKNLEDNDL